MGTPQRKYNIETEREDDGRWLAEIRKVPGAMAYGKTKREAIRTVVALAKNWKMKCATKAESLYERANKEWSRGRLRAAFRHFLAAARAGHVYAFYFVGESYDYSRGIKFNESAELYWYLRAARHGDSGGANNAGCTLRDQNTLDAALRRFRKAVKPGDEDANLNLAKIYLHRKRDRRTALRYLKATCKAKNAFESSKEQAREMIRDINSGLCSP